MVNTSTKPLIETVQKNEQLFRNILRDAKSREHLIPDYVNPDEPLEKLLEHVPYDTRFRPQSGNFKIYVFSVGPSEQLFADDLQNNQALFGYDNTKPLSGGGAIMLYEILKNNGAKYLKDVLRSRS